MGKIFFYANINIEDITIGITKKVLSQIETLSNMGYDVYYTAYSSKGVRIYDSSGEIIKERKYSFGNKRIIKYIRRWDLIKMSTNFIKKTSISFDYSYLRFHFFDYSYLNLLRSLKKTGTINIVEAHAFPYKSGKINKFYITYLIDSLYTPIVRKYIDLVAAVSEIKEIWGVETVNIDNGINIEEIELHNKLETKNNEIRLISVANETSFHGYEKIVEGIREYYENGGKRKIKVNLVGVYLKNTKNLIDKYNLNEYFEFYGKLYGKKLDDIYSISDLGLGAFGYRKAGDSGSCIKTKEYFAKGLPFINGWSEPAFDDNYPYVKKIATELDSINIEEVIKFYDSIKEDKELKKNMRKFAEDNYTWKGQFEKIFNTF